MNSFVFEGIDTESSNSTGFARRSTTRLLLFSFIAIFLDALVIAQYMRHTRRSSIVGVIVSNRLLETVKQKVLLIGLLEMRMLLKMEVINGAETKVIGVGDVLQLVCTIRWIGESISSKFHEVELFNFIYFVARLEIKLNVFSLAKATCLLFITLYSYLLAKRGGGGGDSLLISKPPTDNKDDIDEEISSVLSRRG